MKVQYALMQISHENEEMAHMISFLGYAEAKHIFGESWEPSPENYFLVYKGEMEVEDTTDLMAVNDMLWDKFNAPDRPNGVAACSMSVSDINIVDGHVFYVDNAGFKELTDKTVKEGFITLAEKQEWSKMFSNIASKSVMLRLMEVVGHIFDMGDMKVYERGAKGSNDRCITYTIQKDAETTLYAVIANKGRLVSVKNTEDYESDKKDFGRKCQAFGEKYHLPFSIAKIVYGLDATEDDKVAVVEALKHSQEFLAEAKDNNPELYNDLVKGGRERRNNSLCILLGSNAYRTLCGFPLDDTLSQTVSRRLASYISGEEVGGYMFFD